MAERKPLTPAMSNLDASTLGRVSADVGRWNYPGVANVMDRGLALLGKLNEAGYDVVKRK